MLYDFMADGSNETAGLFCKSVTLKPTKVGRWCYTLTFRQEATEPEHARGDLPAPWGYLRDLARHSFEGTTGLVKATRKVERGIEVSIGLDPATFELEDLNAKVIKTTLQAEKGVIAVEWEILVFVDLPGLFDFSPFRLWDEHVYVSTVGKQQPLPLGKRAA